MGGPGCSSGALWWCKGNCGCVEAVAGPSTSAACRAIEPQCPSSSQVLDHNNRCCTQLAAARTWGGSMRVAGTEVAAATRLCVLRA
jgi:hypothetical protein